LHADGVGLAEQIEVVVRMTAKDYDDVYQLAKQQRVSMAEYIRQQLRRRPERSILPTGRQNP
jgi:hypothetical protein